MNVLIVSPFTDESGGGVGVAVARLSNALREGGTQVTLFAAGDIDLRSRGRVGTWDGTTLRLRPKPLHPFWGDFGPRWTDAIEAEQVRRIAWAVAPDIIHVHHGIGLGLDILPLLAHAVPTAPLVYTHHDAWAVCQADGMLLRHDTGEYCSSQTPSACARCTSARGNLLDERTVFARNLHSKIIMQSLVDAHTSPSAYFADRLQHELEVPVRVLPNIPPAAIGPQLTRGASARRSRIGFFGQLTRSKGIFELLEAVARYNLSHPELPVTLDVYGSGPLDAEVRMRAEGRADVRLHGAYRAQAASQLMQGVDWVALPSIWPEVAPIVIYEALAAGRPLIVAGRGGKREHVDFGSNALEVRDDSVESWVDALALSQSESVQARWAAMADASQPLTTPRVALNEHLALYRELIDGGTRRVAARP